MFFSIVTNKLMKFIDLEVQKQQKYPFIQKLLNLWIALHISNTIGFYYQYDLGAFFVAFITLITCNTFMKSLFMNCKLEFNLFTKNSSLRDPYNPFPQKAYAHIFDHYLPIHVHLLKKRSPNFDNSIMHSTKMNLNFGLCF